MADDARSERPLARWKTLVMDTAAEDTRLSNFWAGALGLGIGDVVRTGPPDVVAEQPGLGVQVSPVPQDPAGKNRVHLDVFTASVEDLHELGAKPHESGESDEGLPWTVMVDPAGGELCAFVTDPLPDYRLHAIVVDCDDAASLARWWGEAFGVEALDHEDHWTLEGAHPHPDVTLDFVDVSGPKKTKNRIHWDLYGDHERLREHGAHEVWTQSGWTTMTDPEGNEFCVHADRGQDPGLDEETA